MIKFRDRVSDIAVDIPFRDKGTVVSLLGKKALIEWDDGMKSYHNINDLYKIIPKYKQPIPAREAWLFENEEALKRVKRGLKQSVAGQVSSLGDFTKYLEDSSEDWLFENETALRQVISGLEEPAESSEYLGSFSKYAKEQEEWGGIESYSKGDKVELGSGEKGVVVGKEERVGFSGYKVKITQSEDPSQVGSVVGASPGGMKKISSKSGKSLVFCLIAGENVVSCNIAKTEKEQRLGLQTYALLEENEGLLFPYEPEQTVIFHMGSVSFPIDMIGIKNGEITKIYSNIQPGTTNNFIFKKITAVLEVPGNFCEKNQVGIGDKVSQYQSYDSLRNITEAGINTQPWDNFIDPTYPGEELPSSDFTGLEPGEKRKTKPSDSWKDRQLPADIVEDSPKQEESYGSSPLDKSDWAFRSSQYKRVEDFEIGGTVVLTPRAGDLLEGIREGTPGVVIDIQDELIAVEFDNQPVVKWIDRLDLNVIPSEEEEEKEKID